MHIKARFTDFFGIPNPPRRGIQGTLHSGPSKQPWFVP